MAQSARSHFASLWVILFTWGAGVAFSETLLAEADPEVNRLSREVAGKGWIAFSARTELGDWDIWICRPDGTDKRNLTHTPGFNEGYPLFSREGTQLLYRQLPKSEAFDGNRHGEQGVLVLANSDGSGSKIMEGEWPWASWSPDGKELACLSLRGISIREVASGKERLLVKRQGFFQQLTWSPAGSWFSGVSNAFGTGWSVGKINVTTGETRAVSAVDCCTPDWFPDGKKIIFSKRMSGPALHQGYGWTQLWMAREDGTDARLVYAEEGRHIYGGHVSPDGNYVLFTGNAEEDGDPSRAGAPMSLMRVSDAPIIAGLDKAADAKAKSGPVLKLPHGWEPCWTFSETPGHAKP
ncbi:MAG: hypothetical protein RL693_2640 [Verrucomicrobiota bacterium]|jgi:Tol biopolymer transport system component